MELNKEIKQILKNSIGQPYHVDGDIWLVPCLASYTSNEYKPLARPVNLSQLESDAGPYYWTQIEDKILHNIVQSRGAKAWNLISRELNALVHQGVQVRQGKNCRERWKNHINPELVKGKWEPEEDKFILEQYNILGSRWSKIAKGMKGRTENSVKNRCHYLIKQKRLELKTDLDLEKLSNVQVVERNLENELNIYEISQKGSNYNEGVVIRSICDRLASREKIRSARQRLKEEEKVPEATPSPSIFLC